TYDIEFPFEVPEKTIKIDGLSEDWASIDPIATDSENDSSCGDGTDIKSIYFAKDSSFLYWKMDTWGGNISDEGFVARQELRFEVIPANETEKVNFLTRVWEKGESGNVFTQGFFPDLRGAEFGFEDEVVEGKIPLKYLEGCQFVQVEIIFELDGSCDYLRIYDNESLEPMGNEPETPEIQEDSSRITIHKGGGETWQRFGKLEVSCALFSNDGTILWVGTNQGLEKRDAITGKLLKRYTTFEGLSSNSITDLKHGVNNSIWILNGTYNNRASNKPIVLFRGENDIQKIFDQRREYYPFPIVGNSFISDNNGGVWIATDGEGLFHVDSSGFVVEQFHEYNSELPTSELMNIIPDDKGGFYVILTKDYHDKIGYAHFIDGKWEIVESDYHEIESIYSQKEEHDDMDIINHLNINQDNSRTPYGLFDNETLIWSISSDNFGNLWFKNYESLYNLNSDGGFTQIDGKLTHWISDDAGGFIFSEASTSSRFDVDTLVHLGSNGETERIFLRDIDISANDVQSLMSDGHGGAWLGGCTQFHGCWLAHYSPGSDIIFFKNIDYTQYYETSCFKNEFTIGNECQDGVQCSNFMTDIKPDGVGGLWIATREGVLHFTSEKLWEIFAVYDNENYKNLIIKGRSEALILQTINDDLEQRGYVKIKPDGSQEEFHADEFDQLIQYDSTGRLWGYSYDKGLGFLQYDNTYHFIEGTLEYDEITYDCSGGFWIKVNSAVFDNTFLHLNLLGEINQIDHEKPSIKMTWFLNRDTLELYDVKYFELQRSLSLNGSYETVLDLSNKPVRFPVDYNQCEDPRLQNCWPEIEGHSPHTREDYGTITKGYQLDIPIIDTKWLEGLSRYYRLSAVVEKEGEEVRLFNSFESVLMAPTIAENPRVGITPERTAMIMTPGAEEQITVFLSSLELFSGDIDLFYETSDDIFVEINPDHLTLNPGDVASATLTISAPQQAIENASNIGLYAI
ncbi:MAG: hypothetical protein HQK65_22565, partial [Desulfamplus sp.]|nr:hypothetical protein [Desulfamplus sp.]